MPNMPPQQYPEMIDTSLRLLCEQTAHFERAVILWSTRGVEEIFERHPNLDALAYQLNVSPCSEEVHNELAGVIVAGKRDSAHPANTEAKLLVDTLERAADHLWAGDCYERAVLARRTTRAIEITEYSPRDHAAETLLDLVESGESIPEGLPASGEPVAPCAAVPSRRVVLTIADVADLATGSSINVPGGPRDQEINVFGEDFDQQAIAALRAGGFCEVDGFTFTAEQPTAPENHNPRQA